ncbi:MAG: DUF4142 domain-containing protein [Pseudomonadota bacterium]|nr:DUF4142 domain-containing protein [Pseudomonadota bacterium]
MNRHLIRPFSLALILACTGAGLQAQAQGSGASGASGAPAASTPATSAGSASASGSAAATPVRASDRTFMVKAAGSGMYEVEASRLAEQKATDQSIKELASMLVKHHTDANNELMQLASTKGVSLPAKLPRDKQGELDKMSKLSGSAFDREYMRKVGIAAHQNDIKLFEKSHRSARDAELKAWIGNTLPTLRDHLAQAQKIPMPTAGSSSAGSSKGSGATGGTSGSMGTGAGTGGSGSGSGATTGAGSGGTGSTGAGSGAGSGGAGAGTGTGGAGAGTGGGAGAGGSSGSGR